MFSIRPSVRAAVCVHLCALLEALLEKSHALHAFICFAMRRLVPALPCCVSIALIRNV